MAVWIIWRYIPVVCVVRYERSGPLRRMSGPLRPKIGNIQHVALEPVWWERPCCGTSRAVMFSKCVCVAIDVLLLWTGHARRDQECGINIALLLLDLFCGVLVLIGFLCFRSSTINFPFPNEIPVFYILNGQTSLSWVDIYLLSWYARWADMYQYRQCIVRINNIVIGLLLLLWHTWHL